MNRPIAMTDFASPRPRQDERPMGAAEDDPAGKLDYALIIVGVVYVVFGILGFFIGDISGF